MTGWELVVYLLAIRGLVPYTEGQGVTHARTRKKRRAADRRDTDASRVDRAGHQDK